MFQINPQPQVTEQIQNNEVNLDLALGMQQDCNLPNQPRPNPVNYLVEEFPPEELMATGEQEANADHGEELEMEGNLIANNTQQVQIQMEGHGP